MKIFIIVVTYNGSQWIRACLNALTQNQAAHILVVDNCSNDDTAHIIREEYPQIEFIKSPTNLGFGAANNIGLQKAINENADYVFLINQDVYLQPDTISKLIRLHQKHPNFGILSPIHLDGEGKQLDYNFSTYLNANSCENFISDLYLQKTKQVYDTAFVNAACWMLSIDCLKKVGLFDDLFFHYGEDRNYCQRVLYHGFKIGICPLETIFHDRESRKSVHPNFRGITHYLNETTAALTDIRKSNFEKEFNRVLLLNVLNLLGSIAWLKLQRIKERSKIISYLVKSRTKMKISIEKNKKPFFVR
jgi:GT2 family glycosyltransferase